MGTERSHLELLKQGVEAWNLWRSQHPDVIPQLDNVNFSPGQPVLTDDGRPTRKLHGFDFSRASMRGAKLWHLHLTEIDFKGADLHNASFANSILIRANFSDSHIDDADLMGADMSHVVADGITAFGVRGPHTLRNASLQRAFFRRANLRQVDFGGANLRGANLIEANLVEANLANANLTDAILQAATLVGTNVEAAVFDQCLVYGIAAWDLKGKAVYKNLRVSPLGASPLYVEDLEVAQIIHLMVQNPKIRSVLDAIMRKGVLILGRFTPDRKAILDALKQHLRDLGFVPMIFDFEKPTQRDFEETVKVLAGLSRFVIVDITNPSSSPLEIHATVPDYMIPFVPILASGEKPFSMFGGMQKYPWVLDIVEYPSETALIRDLTEAVVEPALKKEAEISALRSQGRSVRRLSP